MNMERAEHLCSFLPPPVNIDSETIQMSSIDDQQFYNVKLVTLGFNKGDMRDSVIHPSSPKYYAIKSHIRHFYSPPEEDIFDSGEFMEVSTKLYQCTTRKCTLVSNWPVA